MTTSKNPVTEGNQVLIRTVTNYFTGRILTADKQWVVLEDAAWIPDTGRFSDALAKGVFNEVEPYPETVAVNRGSIIDITSFPHDLPRGVK